MRPSPASAAFESTRTVTPKPLLILALALASVGILAAASPLPPGVTRVPLVFSGGHDLVPVDHGRPVVLIAAALGVKDQVFRDAFSRVHPAGPGRNGPTDSEARSNKQVLMQALGKYGVTNDRLNAVSTFYRYASWKGEMWKHQAAAGSALVKDGQIVGFEITSGGYGYTTPPTVSVPAFPGTVTKVTLTFGPDFASNGSVAIIAPAPAG